MLGGTDAEILFSRFVYKSNCLKNMRLFSDLEVLIWLNWPSCHIFPSIISYRRSNLRNIPAEDFKFLTLNSGKNTFLKIFLKNLKLACSFL